ncbi:uncharacterized protein LOC106158359, partial [Lingula anatina]|uniref:Uncharacterized protein LOC106158359 n=1 Tax=Lingula anatina TaxID=7574 RepID=A0A1S3HW21_LINAN
MNIYTGPQKQVYFPGRRPKSLSSARKHQSAALDHWVGSVAKVNRINETKRMEILNAQNLKMTEGILRPRADSIAKRSQLKSFSQLTEKVRDTKNLLSRVSLDHRNQDAAIYLRKAMLNRRLPSLSQSLGSSPSSNSSTPRSRATPGCTPQHSQNSTPGSSPWEWSPRCTPGSCASGNDPGIEPDEKKMRLRRGHREDTYKSRRVAGTTERHKDGVASIRNSPTHLPHLLLPKLSRRRLWNKAEVANHKPPLVRFRQAVKTVIVLLKATRLGTSQARPEKQLISFAQYQDEVTKERSSFGDDLSFDPSYYRTKRETQISNEAKSILSKPPSERTEEQLKVALASLKNTVESFTEFPINMQLSLVKVGFYEHFEAKRVIIRQGHTADNFYFIASGK